MADALDLDEMIQRFRDRAQAVKNRPLPPIAGEERARFVRQAQLDFQDFAMLADAEATLEDGVLTLRVDLRPHHDDD
jgi:limonene-1,2-epoxide hydrolase